MVPGETSEPFTKNQINVNKVSRSTPTAVAAILEFAINRTHMIRTMRHDSRAVSCSHPRRFISDTICAPCIFFSVIYKISITKLNKIHYFSNIVLFVCRIWIVFCIQNMLLTGTNNNRHAYFIIVHRINQLSENQTARMKLAKGRCITESELKTDVRERGTQTYTKKSCIYIVVILL